MMNNPRRLQHRTQIVDKKFQQFGMRMTPKSTIYRRKKQREEEGKQR